MQRITITIEDALLEQLDAYMEQSGATNRSEALRDLLRRGLQPPAAPEAECVGIVSYTLDPTLRDLGRRVPKSRQEHHDRTVSALSVPLDHDAVVEVAVMRGSVGTVSAYANGLFMERGVSHGQLALIPVQTEVAFHNHGQGQGHTHTHLRVRDSF